MRSAAQMFHAYTRAPWTSKTASIATRKRMTNKHTCRNWHGQVIFLHTPWLQGTCKTHATMCGQLGRLCQQSRGRGALEGARTCHCSRRGRWSCAHHAARSCRIMHTQVAQHCATTSGTTGPGLHSSGQARERPCNALHGHCGRRRRPMPCLACSGRACGRAGGLQQRTKGRRHRCIRTWCRPRRWAHRQPGPRACRAADRAAGTRRGPTVTPPARPRERLQDSAG